MQEEESSRPIRQSVSIHYRTALVVPQLLRHRRRCVGSEEPRTAAFLFEELAEEARTCVFPCLASREPYPLPPSLLQASRADGPGRRSATHCRRNRSARQLAAWPVLLVL